MDSPAQRYLALGRTGLCHGWRYLAGIAIIAVFWIGLGMLPYALIAGGRDFDPLLDYIGVNLSVIVMLAGLALALRLLHRRSLMTLVAPGRRIAWRRVGQGAGAWAVLMTAALVVEHLIHPDRYALTFDAARFFAFAAVALVLTPIQTTTEELVFRGYVMQGLATVMRRPAAVALASAAIFTVPHLYNPEMQYGALLLAASYFTIGLLLAAVTLADGRLELALGVHAANNLMLVLVANYEGSVLATEPILTAREFDAPYSFAALAVCAIAFYAWFCRRSAPAPGPGHD